ncbi:MAG: RDD family protein [Gemmatimonadetes bacterium]|nr:RDD family protein [Gemmatimonadota bacterium]
MLQLLGWGVLGGVAALIGLRLATRRVGAPMSPAGRGALGCASAVLFMVATGVTLFTASSLRDRLARSPDAGSVAVEASAGGGLGDLVSGAGGLIRLGNADDVEEAVAAAAAIGQALADQGLDRAVVGESLAELVDESSDFDSEDVVAPALPRIFGPAEEEPEAPELPPEAREIVAGLQNTVAELGDALQDSEERARQAEAALGQVEPSSTLFSWVRDAADEAGLIFGWGTVYLTLFLVLWDGRTPGKKALDLRVVRLNGEPLTLFLSLERAGGYAAGLATGLLGFAQVWWDPNRQAIHDKIAETVVIRDSLPPPAWARADRLVRAGALPAEGKPRV